MPENSFTRKARLIAWISVAAFALAGCSELPAPAPITPVDYRGCVLSQSDESDKTLTQLSEYSLNQSAVSLGIQRTDLATTATKLTSGVKSLVKSGCDLIVVSGAAFEKGIVSAAAKNPDTNFVYLSEQAEPDIALANLDNLVSYGVDIYEVGLIAGYLAADLSKTHFIIAPCQSGIGESVLSGARFGATRFDSENGTVTRVDARLGTLISAETVLPDVEITSGCSGVRVANADISAYVGYGRDNYLLSDYADVKQKVATTVVPQLAGKLMEVVASDLEGDFIGGSLGSITATYANGLLALAPEHEIQLSSATLTKLQTVIADYEATLK